MMSLRVTLGGGEVFEGLALGGVAGGDSAVDPDAEEDLGLSGLDRAALRVSRRRYDTRV
jgi:hypothetical protein